MKRILVSIFVAFQPVVIGALLGADYSQRGFALGFTYYAALALGGIAYFFPGWNKP